MKNGYMPKLHLPVDLYIGDSAGNVRTEFYQKVEQGSCFILCDLFEVYIIEFLFHGLKTYIIVLRG
jgi:hypothetical protein